MHSLLKVYMNICDTVASYCSVLVTPLFVTNEVTFVIHSLLVALFAIGAVKLGRGALTAFMAVCWVLGNFFVTKQATLFGLEVVTSDAFAIGANIAVTLIQQYYGKKAAQNAIWIGFYCALFFALMSQVHLFYVPNTADITHGHFFILLERMARMILSSFFVAFISMNLNIYLFEFFNRMLAGHYFMISAFSALAISQVVDTVLFTLIALSGHVVSVMNIILFSSTVKIIALLIGVPVVSFARTFIKGHSTL